MSWGYSSEKQLLDWGNFYIKERSHAPNEIDIPPYEMHFLSFYVEHPLTLFQVRGKQVQRKQIIPGDLTLDPAYLRNLWQWTTPCHLFHINIRFDFLEGVARHCDIDPARVELRDCLSLRDPQLQHIVALLRAELHQQGRGGRLYGDSLANILAVHLLRHYATRDHTLTERSGGLRPSQLHQAIEYLHANLERDISLSDVASSVGLSMYHFSRQFKASMGRPPHQYLLELRLERAKTLLETTEQPIGHIALEVGFSNPAHFTAHFRRAFGVLPSYLRQQRKNLSLTAKLE